MGITATARPKRVTAIGIGAMVSVGAVLAIAAGSSPLEAMPVAFPSSVVTVEPTRILDTRTGTGLPGVINANASHKLTVTGAVPTRVSGADVTQTVVPTGATGVLLNVTALRPTGQGFISIRPGTSTGEPPSSNLNAAPGQVIPNAVTVALPVGGADDGRIDIWYGAASSTQTTGILIDVVGYTVEAASAGTPGPAGPPGADGADLYTRTIVVNGDGTNAANGAAFLAALTTASANNPTQADRWLVVLEPGTYDVGTTQAVVDDYVSVRGAGQESTLVVGDVRAGSTTAAALIRIGNGSEVAELSIDNAGTTGSGSFAVGISVDLSDDAYVRRVRINIDASSGAPSPKGVSGNQNASITVEDSTITVIGTLFPAGVSSSPATGSNSELVVRRSTVTASGGSGEAVTVSRGSAIIEHSRLDGPASIQTDSVSVMQVSHSVLLGPTSTSVGAVETCLATTTATAFLPDVCP